MKRLRSALGRRLRQWLFRRGFHLTRLSEGERRYLQAIHATGTPLPGDAEHELRPDHPQLADLRRRYAAVTMDRGRRWATGTVDRHLDLRHFRGDTLYLWHYRQGEQVTRLKYYVYLRHVMQLDAARLLDRLNEDGAFGCWTFEFPGAPVVSRDLLDSVCELNFLDRHLGVLNWKGLRVLDIGAGYGRLAHRLAAAAPGLVDYCCVDGVPESTFLSRYYLGFRGCMPPARVIPLDEVTAGLTPDSFDLAINIHSFPECALSAISWWMGQLKRLRVPNLLIVPNDRERLLSLEADGERLSFAPAVEAAGYRLVRSEPLISDPAVRELTGIQDFYLLYQLDPNGR